MHCTMKSSVNSNKRASCQPCRALQAQELGLHYSIASCYTHTEHCMKSKPVNASLSDAPKPFPSYIQTSQQLLQQ